jgi:hypothetical protein
VQQQNAATAPHRNDQIRPVKAFELRQRPLSTGLPLDGKEKVYGAVAMLTVNDVLYRSGLLRFVPDVFAQLVHSKSGCPSPGGLSSVIGK